MTSIIITERIARAAAQDAANRSMRRAGRTKWTRPDYITACEVYAEFTAQIAPKNQSMGENGMTSPTHRDKESGIEVFAETHGEEVRLFTVPAATKPRTGWVMEIANFAKLFEKIEPSERKELK